MAHYVRVIKLLDGVRDLVLHVYIKGDGISADLKDVVILDPQRDHGLPSKPTYVLEKITWNLNGFATKFKFNYLADGTLAWICNPSASNFVDFTPYGGLPDLSNTVLSTTIYQQYTVPGEQTESKVMSSSLDGNGQLSVSSIGMSALGDEGSFLIKLRRNQ